MPPPIDADREEKINKALAAYKAGDPSIRNLALRYGLPRSTLRDRIKRANITKDTVSPQVKRETMLKSRAKVISEKQFKDNKQREREQIIQEALEYYATEDGQREGLRSLAAKFGIPRSTLRGRILGSINPRYRVQKGQKLSQVEEEIMVQSISKLCALGEEVSLSRIRNMANVLQQYRISRLEDDENSSIPRTVDPETGKVNQVCLGWVRGFLGRHPELIDAKGRILEAEKVKALSQDLFQTWYKTFQSLVVDNDVGPARIFNFDATKFHISQLIADGHRQIVSSDSIPFAFKTSPQPEPFGVLECCSADGVSLDPYFIFGKDSTYFTDLDNSAHPYSTTENSDITEAVLLDWLHKLFLPFISMLPSPVYLLGNEDQPASFLSACAQNRIHFIPIPSHALHELQPLDLGIFPKIKRNFCIKVESYLKTTTVQTEPVTDPKLASGTIPAQDLLTSFHSARKFGVAKANIQKAFKSTGIYPFDPNIVISRVWDGSTVRPYDFAVHPPAPSDPSMSSSDEEETTPQGPYRNIAISELIDTTNNTKIELDTSNANNSTATTAVSTSPSQVPLPSLPDVLAMPLSNGFDREMVEIAPLQALPAPLGVQLPSIASSIGILPRVGTNGYQRHIPPSGGKGSSSSYY